MWENNEWTALFILSSLFLLGISFFPQQAESGKIDKDKITIMLPWADKPTMPFTTEFKPIIKS